MQKEWCTIESDPGVFTELVSKLGASKVQVEEIYSLDDESLFSQVNPKLYGYIFLFKWTRNLPKREVLTTYDDSLFFARQLVTNACATQAILSVVLNSPVKVEGCLKDFYEFTSQMSSEDRGLALSNSEAICEVHNSFAQPVPFIFEDDKRKNRKTGDAFHFVGYVPHKGKLYELDGLQEGPILIGKYETQAEWIALAKAEIEMRIARANEKDLTYNLMVVCENLHDKAIEQAAQFEREIAGIHKRLKQMGSLAYKQEYEDRCPTAEADLEVEEGSLVGRSELLEIRLSERHAFAEQQQSLMRQRKEENERRKHNYVPMILKALELLAKNGKLGELLEKAISNKK